MDLNEPVLLTPEGLEKLKRDLEIALKRRAEAGERLKEAFQPGDIEDNPEYEQAKEEVGLLDNRIYKLQEMIGRAQIIKESHSSVAGRIVIDTGQSGASSEAWPNTEEMAVLWIDEALRELGYEVRPSPDGGRSELKRAEDDWG